MELLIWLLMAIAFMLFATLVICSVMVIKDSYELFSKAYEHFMKGEYIFSGVSFVMPFVFLSIIIWLWR